MIIRWAFRTLGFLWVTGVIVLVVLLSWLAAIGVLILGISGVEWIL